MELKINDNCYCKQDLYMCECYFLNTKYYKVDCILGDELLITNGTSDLIFSINKNNYLYFYDYFYSKQEERAIKLNKLLYDNV